MNTENKSLSVIVHGRPWASVPAVPGLAVRAYLSAGRRVGGYQIQSSGYYAGTIDTIDGRCAAVRLARGPLVTVPIVGGMLAMPRNPAIA